MTAKKSKSRRQKRGQVIFVSKGVYRVRIDLPRPTDLATHKRTPQMMRTFHGTEKKANKYCDELWELHNHETGPVTSGTAFTVGAAVVQWLEWKWGKQITTSSHNAYEVVVNHIIRLMGEVNLREIDTDTIEGYFEKFEAEGLGYSVRKRIKTCLRQTFTWAAKKKLLGDRKRNPMDGIVIHRDANKHEQNGAAPILVNNLPVIPDAPEKYLNPERIEQLLTHVWNDKKAARKFVVYVLLLKTGMRIGEACALRWADIYDGFIYVNRTQSHVKLQNGKWEYQYGALKAKKGQPVETAGRRVTIDSDLQELLAWHQENEAHRKVLAGKRWFNPPSGANGKRSEHDELVFHSTHGTPFTKKVCISSLNDVFAKLGFNIANSTHVFRHTHATLSLMADPGCLRALSERLGHSKFTITLDIYGHLLPNEQDAIATIWGSSDIQKHLPALPAGRGE